MIFLAGGIVGLRIEGLRPGFSDDERIVPIQQRGKAVEQRRQFFVFEQSRGDDELAGAAGNQGGIGLDQLLNLHFGGAALRCSSGLRGGGGGRSRNAVLLIRWAFRSHCNLLGSDVRQSYRPFGGCLMKHYPNPSRFVNSAWIFINLPEPHLVVIGVLGV